MRWSRQPGRGAGAFASWAAAHRLTGYGPGRDPDVHAPLDELGVGVRAVDDQLLADAVRPERPALRVEQVPGHRSCRR